MAYATWRAPIPAVNEPHYLCKARHFWDPAWCARDLFLTSANAHWLFYATVGGLTRWLSFPMAAAVGRALACAGLASGWWVLGRRCFSRSAPILWSCWLFLALISLGSFSGEWIVGGVESKVFAWGCSLWALAAAAENGPLRLFQGTAPLVPSVNRARAVRIGLWLGFGTAWHPLVGGWSTLAMLFAAGVRVFEGRGRRSRSITPFLDQREAHAEGECSEPDIAGDTIRAAPASNIAAWDWRVLLNEVGLATAAWVPASLPGLVPALRMLMTPQDPAQARAADEIQVFDRLKHHLDPTVFPTSGYVWCLALVVILLASRAASKWLRTSTRNDMGGPAVDRTGWPWIDGFVLAAALFAIMGLIIGWGPRVAGLMKYYPFRLIDGFLPIAVGLALADVFDRLATTNTERWGRIAWQAVTGLCAAVAVGGALWAGRIVSPPFWTDVQRADWRDVCAWLDDHTADQALFLTPRYNFGFKWYAQRAEYRAQKDCPQDSASLVEWERRRQFVDEWRRSHFDAGFTRDDVRTLQHLTQIDFIVGWSDQRVDPYQFAPIFRNASFAVYDCHAIDETSPAPPR